MEFHGKFASSNITVILNLIISLFLSFHESLFEKYFITKTSS